MLLVRYVFEGALQIEVLFTWKIRMAFIVVISLLESKNTTAARVTLVKNLEREENIWKFDFTYHHIFKLKSEDFSISV